MMKTPFTLAVLFCATALISFADETASKERLEQLFRNFDANHDGSVTLDEYKAGMVGNMAPERVAAVFQQKDRDKDGKLTMQELLAAPSDDTARSTEKKDGKKSAGQDGSKKTK